MKWVINIPVWGEAYRRRWLERGYPAICAALQHAEFPEHRWIVHTDKPDDFTCLFHDDVKFEQRPADVVTSRELGTADRLGFFDTKVGEAIMFLNADMVPSLEVFTRCEQIFRETRKTFVSCPALRTVDRKPPIGAFGDVLAAWSLAKPHQFTRDCYWRCSTGGGGCKLPPYVLFEKDDTPGNVVMHAFDLHPLAIFKDRDFALVSPTASEFIGEFPWRAVYVVRSAAEMVIAEPVVSCDYARFKSRAFTKRDVVSWARHAFTARNQQLQFRQQIVLRGLGDPQAQAVASDIYAAVIKPEPFRFRLPISMPDRIAIGLAVPPPLRRLIPKSVREWIKNFEIREMGWPRP